MKKIYLNVLMGTKADMDQCGRALTDKLIQDLTFS